MRARSAAVLGIAAFLALAAALAVVALRQRILDALPPTWRIQVSALRHGITVDHGVTMVMKDGTRLTASVYLPRGGGKRATILIRTPYHRLKDGAAYFAGLDFAEHGFASVVQDLRGTGQSGGELVPYAGATADGAATLDWIVAQPWSDGKVGTFGCSGLGESQFALAKARHPAHRAMVASGAGGAAGQVANRHNYFGVFEGGVPQLASAAGWFIDNGTRDKTVPPARPFDRAAHLGTLPVRELVRKVRGAPSGFEDFMDTPLADPKWGRAWDYLEADDKVEPPLLLIDTWGDQSVGDTLAMAEAFRRADPSIAARQRVVIAPGIHCHERAYGSGVDRFGELEVRGGGRPWGDWVRGWFDHWLRGGPWAGPSAPYHYFMMGEDRWLDATQWPPADARTERWHLDGGGKANSRDGDGVLSAAAPAAEATDAFRYDPADPVPSRGGPVCCTGLASLRGGPADQADVEKRADVLVYTTPPLVERLRIAGPLKARLTVSSSAPDTDIVARIAHVFPDGRSIGLQEGALRLRYRDGYADPAMMEPARRYEIEVDMRAIAYTIPKGHRLRLHVTSSSFPRLERNLNTGAANNAAETRIALAANHVHHGGNTRAWLEIHTLPP